MNQGLLGLNRANVPNHLPKGMGLELHLEGWEDFMRQGREFKIKEQPEQR